MRPREHCWWSTLHPRRFRTRSVTTATNMTGSSMTPRRTIPMIPWRYLCSNGQIPRLAGNIPWATDQYLYRARWDEAGDGADDGKIEGARDSLSYGQRGEDHSGRVAPQPARIPV